MARKPGTALIAGTRRPAGDVDHSTVQEECISSHLRHGGNFIRAFLRDNLVRKGADKERSRKTGSGAWMKLEEEESLWWIPEADGMVMIRESPWVASARMIGLIRRIRLLPFASDFLRKAWGILST